MGLSSSCLCCLVLLPLRQVSNLSRFGTRGRKTGNSPSAAAKSLQSCPTLCDPIDGSPPGSTVPGVLQAGTMGVGCRFLLQCMKMKSERESLSRVRLFTTPWTAAHQAPPSMGLSRQEYWSGVPSPSPSVLYCKSLQSCPTLCDPINGSPLGSPIPGILKARTLEWVAISFSNA